MKNTFLILLMLCNFAGFSQYLYNGGFEKWNNVTYYTEPNGYISSNENFSYTGLITISRSPDFYLGKYSLKVQTSVSSTDTVIGVAQTGNIDMNGKLTLGFPYNGKPTVFNCYLKFNATDEDPCFISINFKKDGNFIEYNPIFITGTQNTWSLKNYPLKGLTLTPDTIVIEIASSAIAKKKKSLKSINPTNWIMIDNISFTGAAGTIPNNDFEYWNNTNSYEADGWSSVNKSFIILDSIPYVTPTMITHSGENAMSIVAKNILMYEGFQTGTTATTGKYANRLFKLDGTPNIYGGFPVKNYADSISFWYKYDNSNNLGDSALFILDYKKFPQSHRILVKLPVAEIYTRVNIDIEPAAFTPDSANIILSSVDYTDLNNLGIFGNRLDIDDIKFHYTGVNVSGKMTYGNNANTAMNNSKVYLRNEKNKPVDSTMTNSTGDFLFTSVPSGSYYLYGGTSKNWRQCTSADALKVSRAFVGISPFKDALTKKAADVNLDTKQNTSDALQILRRYVKLISKFAASDWLFENPSFSVLNSPVNLNFKAICAGDVNASYVPLVK